MTARGCGADAFDLERRLKRGVVLAVFYAGVIHRLCQLITNAESGELRHLHIAEHGMGDDSPDYRLGHRQRIVFGFIRSAEAIGAGLAPAGFAFSSHFSRFPR
jgi:hypothetical protein